MSAENPSEEQEFHPAVESIMVTSGPDIGRIKDVDTAHAAANLEAEKRDSSLVDSKYVASDMDRFTKAKVAGEAASKVDIAGAIAVNEVYGNGMDQYAMQIAKDEAKSAANSYDELQEKARPISQAEQSKEKDAEIARLRKKIAEADQSS